ncbi:hypothetical protein [Mycobacterium sp. DBP42]|uniref:hypothetical protein n=1 Tax=Mycobacteriaceae TaxID=1762 RepID=UPI00110D229A|nr:hypothetical protein [Mycobacterium sp. DBP42]TMS46985.1 hypothetical protein E0T84_29430 [Mycobacterium sp. DBP42]
MSCRHPSNGNSVALRPRILPSDARMVARRLEDAADALGLAGASRHVLAAVIELLPLRWKRVRDDRVQLAQLAELCPVPHHQRTVGRELAKLAERELITYTPAQGRGRTATITIHKRLLDGVDELARDESGGCIVPFSRRRPYISQGKYPPTPQTASHKPHRTRPSEVTVNPNDVRRVLAEMPTVFAELPKRLQWLLGRAIRDKLARGWRAEDLLAVLAAELPADVSHPYRLAKWRFSKNLIGSGPRLAPLQKAYDDAVRAQQRQQDHERDQREYERVCAATTPAQRQEMIRARTSSPEYLAACERLRIDPANMSPDHTVVQAARIAQRENPTAPLSAAIATWLRQNLAFDPAIRAAGRANMNPDPDAASLHWLATGGECMSCSGRSGQAGRARPELPLYELNPDLAVVCDDCWSTTCLDQAS